MPFTLHSRLLVLLALAALCVPRGMALGWCLCAPAAADGGCCAVMSCCGGNGGPTESARAEHGGDCCRSFEVEDFDERVDGRAPVLSEAHPPAAPVWLAVAPAPRAPRVVAQAGRAPPGSVVPPGRWPGVLPLRI